MSDATKSAVPAPHWPNPWNDAVPVPIEELAGCHGGLLTYYGVLGSDERVLMTVEVILAHWQSSGEGPLDAYILPCYWNGKPHHSIGVRYGAEGSQYLSPPACQEKTEALLRRYQNRQTHSHK